MTTTRENMVPDFFGLMHGPARYAEEDNETVAYVTRSTGRSQREYRIKLGRVGTINEGKVVAARLNDETCEYELLPSGRIPNPERPDWPTVDLSRLGPE